MLYAIVAIIIFVASFLFAMLGLGGGMVYVPVLTLAGFDVKEVAIPLGLLLNGLNTLLALIPFARKKLVDWKGGAAMALAALLLSPIGAYTAKYVSKDILMIIFAVVVVVAAIRMIFTAKQADPETIMSLKKRSIYGAYIGAFAGFMGGLLGLGGGFIIAPFLMWMGYKTKQAAATSAYVVTFSSFSGYFGHIAQGHFEWKLGVVLVVAVIIGSQVGSRFLTNQAKSKQVKIVYAIVLLIIAFKMILEVVYK